MPGKIPTILYVDERIYWHHAFKRKSFTKTTQEERKTRKKIFLCDFRYIKILINLIKMMKISPSDKRGNNPARQCCKSCEP